MKVSCIVPIYNEARRMSDVIDILLSHPDVDEVIAVNDGSTDRSAEILKTKQELLVVTHEKNQGKTKAVLSGLHTAKNELIMLIDADLKGLSEKAVTDLIEPVKRNEADITISLRKNALSLYRLLGIDFVSGERVFAKRLLIEHEQHLRTISGFGLEVYLNKIILKNQLRIRIVRWPQVVSPRKISKVGFFLGSLADIRMLWQIFSTISVGVCVYQIYEMRRRSRMLRPLNQ